MQTLGIAIIAKNEEALIGRCLESVYGADEIVVVDTGSTDSTIEVAKRYTTRVYDDFTWCDDFQAARNHVRLKMTTDWILSIDCDEYLWDMRPLREIIDTATAPAINVKLYAEDNNQWHDFPRLFRNLPTTEWHGAVHNHLNVLGESIGDVRITYGFSPAHLQDPDREYRMLLAEAAKPDGVRARFYLGRKYAYRHEWANCIKTLGQYVQESNFPAEKAEAFLIISKAYWYSGDADSSRDAILQSIAINANFKESVEHMRWLCEKADKHEDAAQWQRMVDAATNSGVLFVRECV